MESILTSIKKLLGITEEYTHFDEDLIMHINSVFMILTQIGVGPSEGFHIEDSIAEWTDFVPDLAQIHAIKTYIYLRVRLLFDPSSLGSATLAAYERQITELEVRLNIIAESTLTDDKTFHGDYTKLKNLPKINGETLVDNYNEKDPAVPTITTEDNGKVMRVVDGVWTASDSAQPNAHIDDAVLTVENV